MPKSHLKANPPYRACILGTPVSSGNRGVLALGSSLVNLLSNALPGCEFHLLVAGPFNNPTKMRINGVYHEIPVCNHRMSPRSKLSQHIYWIVLMSLVHRIFPFEGLRKLIRSHVPWIKAIVEADYVGDVRGGDSFSDIYGLQRFFSAFFPVWTVIILRGSIIHFPQTYGPFKTKTAKFLAKYLLRRSSIVVARDKTSQAIAQAIVGPNKKVLITPDVAFSLEVAHPETISFDPPALSQAKGKPIGINVNGLMHCGGYTRNNMFGLELEYVSFLKKLTLQLLESCGQDIWLVPHTFASHGDPESDNEACIKLRDSIPKDLQPRIAIVSGNYDQYEIKGVIGQCDFFVGGRMHSCIAALSQGIPCIGTAYSMKFKGVFDSVEAGDWVVDGKVETNEEALEKCKRLFAQKEEMRLTLKRTSEEARRTLTKVFQEIVAKK